MDGKKGAWQMILVVGAALLLPAAASAGPILNWLQGIPPDCSPGSYPCIHYWANNVWNAKAHCFGVKGEPVSIYPEERHLPTPPRFYINSSHCPYESPDGLSDYGRAAPSLAVVTVEAEVEPKVDRLPETAPQPLSPQEQQPR